MKTNCNDSTFSSLAILMSMRSNFLRTLVWFSVMIGVFVYRIEPSRAEQEEGLVEIEPRFVFSNPKTGDGELAPYRERRKSSGSFISLGYSTLDFVSYQPNFSVDDFATAYGVNQGVMIDVVGGVKQNWPLMSVGLEFGLGSYSVVSTDLATTASTLSLLNLRLGLRLALDGLLPEPFIVPYGYAGAYVMQFTESSGGLGFEGNTSPAIYMGAGAMFQLNWLEKSAAIQGYEDSGLENSYLYAELRMYSASEFEGDANVNFETDPSIFGGLSLEF